MPATLTHAELLDQLALDRVWYKRECLRHFHRFVQESWSIVEPAKPFIDNWHIGAKCEHLQAVADGQIQNLLINEPPGHAKSIIASVQFHGFQWARRPEWRLLAATYAQDLTLRDAMRARILIKSQWYRETFWPSWEVDPQQDAKGYFQNTRMGFRYSTSVGGQSTGHRGDCLLIDDPLAATDAESDAARAEVLFWYDQAFANRLNDLKTGTRIVIMQRLHETDLSGHLLKQGDWVHLKLPTEFDPKSRCVTPIGWKDPRTQDGELLFPKLFPAEVIAAEKKRLGSYGYSGQHQQSPAPAGGGKFQRAWFRYFEQDENWYILHTPTGDKRILKADCWSFQTCDLAMSEKESADYTVISTWCVTPENDLLLLDLQRFKAEAPDVKTTLEGSLKRWQPQFQGIERAHYGVEVCQEWLRRGYPLRELIADKDKITRSMAASILLENGKVYWLAGSHWLNDFENELLFFPVGEHDDQVDTFSYAAKTLNEHGGADNSGQRDMTPIPGNERGQF